MPTYYDTLVRTQQLQELRTMPTYYDTLVHAPAAAGVEEDAHLLWLWRGRWGSSCRGSAEVEDDAHLHLHGLVAIPATKRFVNTLRSATAREPGKQLQGICRQLRTMPTCYGNICIHPQVEYSVRGEAAVVGELQAVKNDPHLLLHGLVDNAYTCYGKNVDIPPSRLWRWMRGSSCRGSAGRDWWQCRYLSRKRFVQCAVQCTYPQIGYGEGGEEAVAGDLEAGIGGNGHQHRHVPHHRQ